MAETTTHKDRTKSVPRPIEADTNGLPKHWQLKKLEDVCKIIMGQSPPSNTYNKIGDGLPFFQGKAEFSDLHPIVEKWCSVPNKVADANDILLSVRAPVGATNIADTKCCIGRGLAAIRFENYKYVYYYLKSIEKYLDTKGTGTTFKAISSETLRNVLMPIPPHLEQRAIVSKIEELLSELENGKQQLLTAQQQLKVYRQSLLKWAFEGKLSESGFSGFKDEQDVNTKSKSSKSSNSVNPDSDKGELPKGWKWSPIGDICDMKAGFFVKADNIEKEFKEGLYPCYGGNGLRGFTNSFTHNGKYSLVGRQGALCGNVHRVNGVFYATEHAVVTSPKEGIDSDWLFYKLTAMKLNQYSAGAAQPGLSVNKLLKIEISYPSIAEQQFIVSELESKLTVCDKIEETICKSLQQAETLKQSILKKAFEGRLVAHKEL